MCMVKYLGRGISVSTIYYKVYPKNNMVWWVDRGMDRQRDG